ncbi:hypothetical protein J542_0838 [Acinetobacter baumannii 299505]|nr:hypothetical protein J542_0838 [Acinetobacter baumannii 299505]
MQWNFLNGVCRHERGILFYSLLGEFLNGVCRHERFLSKA